MFQKVCVFNNKATRVHCMSVYLFTLCWQFDLNEVPRSGMEYERGIIVLANPYSEDASRKFNSVEVVFPETGTVKYLCKLPSSLFMPGMRATQLLDSKVRRAPSTVGDSTCKNRELIDWSN